MKAKILLSGASLSLCALGLAGGAVAADKADKPKADENACLFSTIVRDWRALDSRHLLLWGPGRDAYLVEIMLPNDDMRFSETLAVIDRDHNGMICGRGADQIAVPRAVTSVPSFINSMKRLDDAGLKAVAEQYKIKLGTYDFREKKKTKAADSSADATTSAK